MRKGRRLNYKIQCVNDGKLFDTVSDVCEYYKMTIDQVSYRIDHVKEYHDGMNFIRVPDDEAALKTVEAVRSEKYVEKFGDKTVPVPGYEDRYTISTKGVVTNIKAKCPWVLPVKTQVTVKNTVILHNDYKTQTHSVEGLLKRAFGEIEETDKGEEQ